METTPMRAIRAKCLDCCCGSSNEVRLCPLTDCSLYLYRFGKNPARAGIGRKGSSEQKNTNSAHDSESEDVSEGKYTPAHPMR